MSLQSETFFACPYCGERISVLVDHSIEDQEYVEDCEVCCRPITIHCAIEDEQSRVTARRADD